MQQHIFLSYYVIGKCCHIKHFSLALDENFQPVAKQISSCVCLDVLGCIALGFSKLLTGKVSSIGSLQKYCRAL